MIDNFTFYGREFSRSAAPSNGTIVYKASDGSSVTISSRSSDDNVDVSVNSTVYFEHPAQAGEIPSRTPVKSYTGLKFPRAQGVTDNQLAMRALVMFNASDILSDPANSFLNSPAVENATADQLAFGKMLLRL